MALASSALILLVGCASSTRFARETQDLRLGVFTVDGHGSIAVLESPNRQPTVKVIVTGKRPDERPTSDDRLRADIDFAGGQRVDSCDHDMIGFAGGGDVSEIHRFRFDFPAAVVFSQIRAVAVYVDGGAHVWTPMLTNRVQ